MQQQNQMTRDDFNKAHVACIVLGKDDKPSTDELIGENYAFGKWIDLEADEETWNTKIHELQEALENPELQQEIKGIKFILNRHGNKDLTLSANNTSIDYKSRLEKVASIINSDGLQSAYNKMGEFIERMQNVLKTSEKGMEELKQQWSTERAQTYFSEIENANNDIKLLISEYDSVRNQIQGKLQILREMGE